MKKAPISDEALHRALEPLGADLAALRDRALMTLGWFGAFRRSELVALEVVDLSFGKAGLVVLVRRSKTDQEGRGEEKGIPFARNVALCPVRSVRAWLDASGITSGPIFRRVDRHGYLGSDALTDGSVARIVKRLVEQAGLDPNVFAGHSLRSGFITTAAAKGKSLDAIMRQSLHRSERVARGYIRHATLFVDNAADGLV
jgi:integrase